LLGTNTELPHLRVGRRIAFDTRRGRLWVICAKCGQWNLTPIEERWEALEECDRLAASAEARSGAANTELAVTASGLELLRVGAMSDTDIANWRYGRRIDERRKRQQLALMPMFGLAIGLGLAAWRASGMVLVGLYVTTIVGFIVYFLWYNRPRLWRRFSIGQGRRRFLWPWQLQDVRFERTSSTEAAPVLVVPRVFGDLRLEGVRAAAALASLLPGMNGVDSADVQLQSVVRLVSGAEEAARRRPVRPNRSARRKAHERGAAPPAAIAMRPWEHLVRDVQSRRLIDVAAVRRLALEMAATEELEQRELTERTEVLAEEWPEEEVIGAISDDLLLPDGVRERLDELRRK
jgi:hypothetical protein